MITKQSEPQSLTQTTNSIHVSINNQMFEVTLRDLFLPFFACQQITLCITGGRLKRTIINMFGVVFPNRSFPIDISTFSQIDTFHWVLDMNHFVGKHIFC